MPALALRKYTDEKDIGGSKILPNRQAFSTCDQKQIDDGFRCQARIILSDIGDIAGSSYVIHELYDVACKLCRFNASGHLFAYGEIGKTIGTVAFLDLAPRVKGISAATLTCFMLILLGWGRGRNTKPD